MTATQDRVAAWRRHRHRDPEVSLAEHDTSASVTSTLASLAMEGLAGLRRGSFRRIRHEVGSTSSGARTWAVLVLDVGVRRVGG